MPSMGLPELVVVLAIAGLLVAPFYLRRRVPGSRWLALLLALLLGPWGHWYVPGGVIYVIALVALPAILNLTVTSSVWAWELGSLVSLAVMFYRCLLYTSP